MKTLVVKYKKIKNGKSTILYGLMDPQNPGKILRSFSNRTDAEKAAKVNNVGKATDTRSMHAGSYNHIMKKPMNEQEVDLNYLVKDIFELLTSFGIAATNDEVERVMWSYIDSGRRPENATAEDVLEFDIDNDPNTIINYNSDFIDWIKKGQYETTSVDESRKMNESNGEGKTSWDADDFKPKLGYYAERLAEDASDWLDDADEEDANAWDLGTYIADRIVEKKREILKEFGTAVIHEILSEWYTGDDEDVADLEKSVNDFIDIKLS